MISLVRYFPALSRVEKLEVKMKRNFRSRFFLLQVLSFGFIAFSNSIAVAQMHQDSEGRWVNEAGGNIYGDSNFNLDADPNFNLDADPNFNLDADPNFNLDADPNFNLDADPNFSPDGDPRYKYRRR
jgi:hypothetical protein